MADTTTNGSGKLNNKSLSKFGRDQLARLVVVGSFLTIFLLVAVLMVVAQGPNQGPTQIAERAFTTVLPVLAGWVGTVLAFYFSAAANAEALDKVISGAPSTPTATVSDKMIPRASIKGLFDFSNQDTTPDKITLEKLQAQFQQPGISRLVFVNKDIFQYVMHESALNAYLVKNKESQPSVSFTAMLQDADLKVQISTLAVFIKAAATLAEAKDALNAVAGAQDIMVTTTGTASGSLLGWLTNVDLTKALG
jgi:hypothetical protein